jgi:hypothetical protein
VEVRRLVHLSVFVILAASACGTDRDRSAPGVWTARVDTVGDTVTVHTVSGSVWGDTVELVPECSVGGLEAADEYLIGDPAAIAVASDGTLLVLDAQVPAVRVYDPDGVYLRDIGREGQGPGEYDGPDGLAILPDDRVLVRDPGNARISVFDLGGALLEEWPHSGGFNTDRRYYVDDAGNSYVTALLERGLAPWEWTFGLVRYDPSGVVTDTLAAPTWEFEPAQVTASREGSSSVRAVPFTPQVSWTFSPRGHFVGGLSSDYRIDLFLADRHVLRIERDRTPVPVAADEAQERRRRIAEGLQRQYGAWRWNGPSVPDTKPPFKKLFASAEGDVWVVLSTEGRATMSAAEQEAAFRRDARTPLRFVEPVELDVFDRDGRYLGAVRPPPSFGVEPEPIVRGDRVWAVTRDELDVASVTRFRMAGSHRRPTADRPKG